MSPVVSILLFTYNRARYLAKSLPALLNQTYQDFELIVVDNASTDSTAELVRAYADPRLIYLRHSVNIEFLGSWCDAINRVQGKYILMTHDDDIAHPRLVEEEVRVMERDPSIALVGANVRTIDPDGNLIAPCWNLMTEDRLFKVGDYVQALALEHFVIPCTTFMLRRDSTSKRIGFGGPNEAIGPVGDVYLSASLNMKRPVYCLAEPLMDYRLHPGQESWQKEVSSFDINLAKLLIRMVRRRPKLHWTLPALRANYHRYIATRELTETGEADLTPLQGLPNMPNLMPWTPDGRSWNLLWKRVAIFGSSLNAYLLLRECATSEVAVLACLDSRECRHGSYVGHAPIVPFSWLDDHEVDFILSSSDRREAQEVKAILEQGTKQPLRAPVLSWKELP